MHLLKADSLVWKAGPKEIVNVDRFTILKGEICVLLGPNGAGKSSLLNLLALLQPASGGNIMFDGEDAYKNVLTSRRQMAYIFQEPLLLRGKVYDNVALGLKFRGLPAQEIRQRTELWLSKLGLKNLAARNVRNLSGGEAQKVNIARAMVTQPKIFFMDEPFASLDMPTKSSLLDHLTDLLRQTGTSAVIVTHDILEIPPTADRLIIMIEGRIAQQGTVNEVLRQPKNEVIANVLGLKRLHNLPF